ncbi:hypothetical protein BT96DRAFT_1016771 [Gymnopus androsaceus JB14]|uniref:C2 domain-containing protein n=1 Tax=Gymnopus androsaceus JB14 TaxID=1447944 RepID=A0A6A4I078_9AGAR|nr:hypothetical protein BT96DRAFT_1016771 [Gymnopus androsaceus JB14]
MEADTVVGVLADSAPPVPEKAERERDETGNRLATTRSIYESASPQWDETFDISVENPLWLMVSVRDRALTLVGKRDTVGRAYICLDPTRRFDDLLNHDLWMDLDNDSNGRLLVQVGMEGKRNDTPSTGLKRAES